MTPDFGQAFGAGSLVLTEAVQLGVHQCLASFQAKQIEDVSVAGVWLPGSLLGMPAMPLRVRALPVLDVLIANR